MAEGAPVPPGFLSGNIGDGLPHAEAELVLVLRLVGIQHLHLCGHEGGGDWVSNEMVKREGGGSKGR